MRRAKQTPLDLIPIMGLMTLLIPLLLMNQSTGLAFATVDADLPAICACGERHEPDDGEAPVIPSVALGVEHIVVHTDGSAEATFPKDDLEGLGEHLQAIEREHHTTGRAVILPSSEVRYQELIAVMDTVRPHFPASTIASGVD